MAANGDNGIDLVDNTAPTLPAEQDLSRTETGASRSLLRKKFTRTSVKNELQKRKYAKWQRERLGSESLNQSLSRSSTKNTTDPAADNVEDVDLLDIVPLQTQATETVKAEETSDSNSELEVLYENQRGWFFFGIPFYSHRSLLQIDPPAWVNKDYRDSPVNITNAQLPDPSWEWAWQTWYVDMSPDVDEEGWQYSFSFMSSSQWHGTHPWFHSYVRRRRWVRLRVKKKHARMRNGEQTEFSLAHMLNEDYFTIHSRNLASVEPSIAPPTVPSSAYTRQGVEASPERPIDENIENIPTLLLALKNAIVDRERIEALSTFIAQGEEELYYLPEKIPEVLALFIFQTSRWQFLKLLQDTIDDAENQDGTSSPSTDDKEVEAKHRRRDNISRTIEAIKKEISQYDIFDVAKEDQEGLGDPVLQRAVKVHSSSSSSRQNKGKERLFKEIKGIPRAAAIGEEGHIY